MKRLILMRHAKSSWSNPALSDALRPLNRRGREAAQVLGRWLHLSGQQIDQALVSSATRTRETYAELGLMANPVFVNALYEATVATMLDVLHKADPKAACVLMIGHNPGIGSFAEKLLRLPPPHGRFFDYPTGATLICDFDIETWAELRLGTGSVAGFTVPRELMGDESLRKA
ncbi:histidine phosphatase family protein [Pseudooceanicola sp. CBS1P-1]|uniref:Histidine phosphatase family protein n=1 Tax=Pseudooceanicola albus TaxID=2692189 RepID=A0A6L7G028_9RHOB|nr:MULTISPECIES: histidine phosphatase family protein [Pseudooceanicola]MBT9382751.1 histidine phosphatase family protein [Pseudooceanicola endophyticus]MXN17289.1 histidine phosphatase family protein [Pseudooceanicola albus]